MSASTTLFESLPSSSTSITYHVSRLALDQHHDLAVAAAEDQGTFPVTWNRPILDTAAR